VASLIDRLKLEHQQIVNALKELKKMGMTAPKASVKMAAVKEALQLHWDREDHELYPLLRKHARGDKDLKAKIEASIAERGVLQKQAMEFFARYADGGNGMDFAVDSGKFVSTLETRIHFTETVIYPEFAKRDTRTPDDDSEAA
jgi:hypothetical protein